MDIYKGSRLDEWGTPPKLIRVDLGLGVYDALDVCASKENHKFAAYWTETDNALTQAWPVNQLCWMNPPYSQARQFFEKAASEAARGVKIIAIYKATNLETDLWQSVIFGSAKGILFIRGRTEYLNGAETKKGVPFGSALIFYNTTPTSEQKKLGRYVKCQ